MNTEKIRLLLKKHQLENRLTINNLTDEIGFSYSTIYLFLNKKRSSTNQFLYSICKYLKSKGIKIPDGIEETLIK